jgi:hypothetical protein
MLNQSPWSGIARIEILIIPLHESIGDGISNVESKTGLFSFILEPNFHRCTAGRHLGNEMNGKFYRLKVYLAGHLQIPGSVEPLWPAFASKSQEFDNVEFS